jgi:hypothetical protein
MRTTGAAMVSSLGILISLYCSTAMGACDLSRYDLTAPSPLRGSVSNNLVNFEYASDADIVGGHIRIWNYVQNQKDRGIGLAWPKAGIGIPLWNPLPPGQTACQTSSADWVNVDTDAPMTYGTTDQTKRASVYLVENQRKLGSTESTVSTIYTDTDGKYVPVDVEVSTSQGSKWLNLVIIHPQGFIVGIANLPEVLSPKQIDAIAISAKGQNAAVDKATYRQFTQEPVEVLGPLFQREKGPNEETNFLFFSGQSVKFSYEVSPISKIEQVATDMIILDEKTRRPVFATGVSLLVPAK